MQLNYLFSISSPPGICIEHLHKIHLRLHSDNHSHMPVEVMLILSQLIHRHYYHQYREMIAQLHLTLNGVKSEIIFNAFALRKVQFRLFLKLTSRFTYEWCTTFTIWYRTKCITARVSSTTTLYYKTHFTKQKMLWINVWNIPPVIHPPPPPPKPPFPCIPVDIQANKNDEQTKLLLSPANIT